MTSESPRRAPPEFGDAAPYVTAATDGVDRYSLDVAAGRWIILMVFGSLSLPASAAAHAAVMARAALFDDVEAAFFGVSLDVADRAVRGLANAAFGIRYFWDFDRRVAETYGLVQGERLQPAVFLIDRSFRVASAAEIERTSEVLDELERQLGLERSAPTPPTPPVLILPRVFEPEFCAELVAMFDAGTQRESGFAAEVRGRTLTVVDPRLKRRKDVQVVDEGLKSRIDAKLTARLFPMVRKAFGWRAEFIERHIVSRYGETDSGFFSAHRDDVTAGTAHRKFAVTILLSDDYEGGDLAFPEFGGRPVRPPLGGAAVFSCALLHEVAPVTRGARYAFVPFLYDADGDRIRQANLGLVGAIEAPVSVR